MDTYSVVACLCLLFLCSLLTAFLCLRCLRSGTKQCRTLVVTEFLQPRLVFKTVPCQHPYYRIMTEYNNSDRSSNHRRVDDESMTNAGDSENDFALIDDRSLTKGLCFENSRSSSISRQPTNKRLSIFNSGLPYRKLSSASSTSAVNSRRSSCSAADDSVMIPISPVFNTKPIFLTQQTSTNYCV